MEDIVATLDVSKLSGWLNARASQKTLFMFVTLDVSRLSGWLNARASRNIWCMFVTLEVSQLDMSALKFRKLWKSRSMSVMDETSQVLMGPYIAVADAGLAMNARTAFFREAVLVKV